MEKVLVLGINGFTGKHFQEFIQKNSLEDTYSFLGVDLTIEKQIDINYMEANLLLAGIIDEILEKETPDYILNLVGLYDSSDFELLQGVNAGIAQKLCAAVVRSNLPVKKILLIGSAAEYGPQETMPITENSPLYPNSLYGLVKVFQTQCALFYHRVYRLNIIVARPFNIIGDGLPTALSTGSFISQIRSAQDGDKITVGNLETKRDYLDIADVVDAYWRILLDGKTGEIYNVCRGESTYVREILEQLIYFSKKSLQIRVKKDLIKKFDILDSFGDNSKLMNDIQWMPTIDIIESLKKLY